MGNICRDCKFYVPDPVYGKYEATHGRCHRNPPQVFSSDHQDQNMPTGQLTRRSYVSFVGVRFNEWCGEWSPRTDEKDKSNVDSGNETQT